MNLRLQPVGVAARDSCCANPGIVRRKSRAVHAQEDRFIWLQNQSRPLVAGSIYPNTLMTPQPTTLPRTFKLLVISRNLQCAPQRIAIKSRPSRAHWRRKPVSTVSRAAFRLAGMHYFLHTTLGRHRSLRLEGRLSPFWTWLFGHRS